MADLKISQLTGATTPLAGTEVLPIVQSSTTKKVATDDLTVKNIRSNATTGILQVAGPGAGTTRTMTIPNANFTAARTDAAQTFTGDQTVSGNVGVEAAPRAWDAGFPAVDVGTGPGAAIAANTTFGFAYLTSNAYYSGGWVRKANDYATLYSAGDGEHYFYTAGTAAGGTSISFSETVKFDASSNVKISNGNLIQGTAAKGVNFTANTPAAGMTSQLLNWYEEGTWTPTTNGDATGSFSSAAGKYTRIGNIVIATGFIIVDANFTAGRIGGLPFTCTAGFGGTGANFSSSVLPYTSTAPLYITVDANAATAQFSENGYSTAHIPNTTTLAYKFTVMYMV